jgi:hypothetical protein
MIELCKNMQLTCQKKNAAKKIKRMRAVSLYLKLGAYVLHLAFSSLHSSYHGRWRPDLTDLESGYHSASFSFSEQIWIPFGELPD